MQLQHSQQLFGTVSLDDFSGTGLTHAASGPYNSTLFGGNNNNSSRNLNQKLSSLNSFGSMLNLSVGTANESRDPMSSSSSMNMLNSTWASAVPTRPSLPATASILSASDLSMTGLQCGGANAVFPMGNLTPATQTTAPVASLIANTTNKNKEADFYAEQGIMGPWSDRAAGLLGSMACTDSSAAPKGKKTRRKQPKDKPKRPLSAYNIFFKEERSRLMERAATQTDAEKKDLLTANGKIGFQSLAKIIGSNWQQLNPEKVEYFKKKAAMDLERYNIEMEAYNKKKKTNPVEDDNDEEETLRMFKKPRN